MASLESSCKAPDLDEVFAGSVHNGRILSSGKGAASAKYQVENVRVCDS